MLTLAFELDPVGVERQVEVCAGHEQPIGRKSLAQAIVILVGLPDDAWKESEMSTLPSASEQIALVPAPSEATSVVVLPPRFH